ncbi:hypothetical protein [Azospirillum argentinense]
MQTQSLRAGDRLVGGLDVLDDPAERHRGDLRMDHARVQAGDVEKAFEQRLQRVQAALQHGQRLLSAIIEEVAVLYWVLVIRNFVIALIYLYQFSKTHGSEESPV